jgi:hypothetical protein
VFTTAEALGLGDYLLYDAGIVRGLDYYTGPVFEAYDRERRFRAIFGGGRYDNLVADVGGERITGVGFAMGDVIIELLLERAGKRPELAPTPSRVLVTLFSPELYDQTLALAGRLRRAGINTEQVLQPARLGKQFRYADRKGIPFVAILGPVRIVRVFPSSPSWDRTKSNRAQSSSRSLPRAIRARIPRRNWWIVSLPVDMRQLNPIHKQQTTWGLTSVSKWCKMVVQ